MKKNKLLFLFAALMFAGNGISAQTVDEIVNKNIEATGGKEKLAGLKTVKMTGEMNVQGTDIVITMIKSHLVGMRLDIDVAGTSNYQVANTKEGWVFMPALGMAEPVQMDEDQLKSYSTQMDIQGALFNYKEKGNTIILDGSEKVNGSDAYKLKVAFKNGETGTYFIDKKTNRLVKTSGKANVQGQEMDIETTFADYKQNADGYWFAYSITNMQGNINFNKIETNIPLEEKVFIK